MKPRGNNPSFVNCIPIFAASHYHCLIPATSTWASRFEFNQFPIDSMAISSIGGNKSQPNITFRVLKFPWILASSPHGSHGSENRPPLQSTGFRHHFPDEIAQIGGHPLIILLAVNIPLAHYTWFYTPISLFLSSRIKLVNYMILYAYSVHIPLNPHV